MRLESCGWGRRYNEMKQISKTNYDTKTKAIKNYIKALKKLHSEYIHINKQSFTCQIGEWLVAELYNGERAKSGTQKGWDIIANGKNIQVKAHAKAENTTSKFSVINKNSSEKIDELIIIVFTYDYKIKHFYKVPWSKAKKHIQLRGKKIKRSEISWSKLKYYEIEIDNLPRQKEIVSIFR